MASSWSYPPATSFESQNTDLRGWLWRHDPEARWVAFSENRIVGYLEAESLVLGDTSGDESHDTIRDTEYWNRVMLSQPAFIRTGLRPQELLILERLAVSPEYRQRRIGRRLMIAAIRYCRQRERIPALVVLEHLTESNTLYSSLGFKEVGQSFGFSGLPLTAQLLTSFDN